jgi:NADPH2 dehydrogenase
LTTEEKTPRELTAVEIKDYVNSFAEAAKNAVLAGFDGVEVHGKSDLTIFID